VTTLGGSIRAQRTGSDVSIDAAKVTTADILTSNGVIHVIDSVLLPSITDVASTDSRYTGLLGAVGSAGGGLAGVLDDDAAKFTIFAPSNDAFSKVTLPPNASLLNVLLYHAVPNAVVYENQARFLFRAQVPTALMNKTLEITGFHGITIKDSTPVRANVTQGDTFTSNGVIHQIDKVLLP
jgi:transforming growth factor-beta-induced protein